MSTLVTLLENINTAREATIATHYAAAVAELEEKVKNEPLKTNFRIYSGCVSKEVAEEIAHRFNSGNVKATPTKGGIVSTQWHIAVETALPSHLVHEEVKQEEVVEKVAEPEEAASGVEYA